MQLLLYLIPSNESVEKLLNVNREIFKLQKKFYGEYSSNAGNALIDVCDALKQLNRIGETEKILEKFYANCTAYLETVTNLDERIKLMETLRDILNWLNQSDNVIWREESRLQIFRDIIEVQTRQLPLRGLQLACATAYGWLTAALQLSCSIDVSNYRVP